MKIEWKLVEKYGNIYAQCRDETCAENEWGCALFPVKKSVDEIEKEIYVWEESIGMYRRKFGI